MFDLKVFFEKSGNIEPRDFSETKRQVMTMLGGSVKARELLKNGTIEVALFYSEILTTRWVDTKGMYGDYILLENYYKLPDAAASSSSGSISIFRHVASQSGTDKLIAFASSESLRTLMEPCEVIKNGERAAIMAALDDTAYDYVQQFSQVPLVRLASFKIVRAWYGEQIETTRNNYNQKQPETTRKDEGLESRKKSRKKEKKDRGD